MKGRKTQPPFTPHSSHTENIPGENSEKQIHPRALHEKPRELKMSQQRHPSGTPAHASCSETGLVLPLASSRRKVLHPTHIPPQVHKYQ